MAAQPKKRRSRFSTLLLLGLIPACSTDGCTGGCGGITPLPGGFVNEERVENAAALRLTESGIDFLEANVGNIAGNLIGADGGIVEFEIPETMGSFDPCPVFSCDINYTVCPGGADSNASPPKCDAEINLGGAELAITPIGPHNIQVAGEIPLRLQYLPLTSSICDMDITLNGNDSCPGDQQDFAMIAVTLEVSIETDLDPAHARLGYSRVRVVTVDISKPDIESALHFCGGFCSDVAEFAKGLIVDQLFGGIQDTLVGTLEEQLCQKANTTVDPPCPNGTNNVDGVCRYGSDSGSECVSIVLGADGHADLSGLLASISPGTKGGLDFLLAAGGQSQRDDGSGQTWGDLNPINNGASISAFGGVEPNPISGCVPLADLVRPSGLKIPNELIDDSLITDWPAGVAGPHVGIGISESFTNYALAGLYNSGLFCIGITTEQLDLLNSGTIGLLAQSLRDLGIQRETQPIAIVIKPTQPPAVTFGNGTNIESDPLIRLKLQQAGFDFYMFSTDRYIRFMTATFDIEAPVNLTVTPEGLVPVLETLKIENGTVNNSELLKEDPSGIAAALSGLLSNQIGSLLGDGLPAVDINGPLADFGIRLVIPETVEGQGSPGLRTLVKDGERYLSIFAGLEIPAQGNANANVVETQAEVTDVYVEEAGLRHGSITKDNAPIVTLKASAENAGGEPVEHQVRIDDGFWKPWTQDSTIRLQSDALRVEGRHTIEVRSRIVGQAYTLDETPEAFDILIDATAPEATISTLTEAGDVNLDVRDLVSKEATQVRYRFDDGAFSSWVAAADLPSIHVPEDAENVEVEMKDESGNVGTAQQAIIRGLPGEGGGCGCVVVGSEPSTPRWPLALLGMALFGSLAARRRRKQAPVAPRGAAPQPKSKAKASGIGAAILASPSRQAVAGAIVLAIGGTYSGCSCDEETDPDPDNYECKAPSCVTLEQGLIGAYTGADVDNDGTVWVSGYLEAAYEQAFPNYGDLVVGKVNSDNKVDWEIVDGVPSDPPPDPKATNVEGFRGGQTAPGDDVGIWTSLAINPASGLPAVSYYDRTNKALKFAERKGDSWTVTTVRDEPEGDVGKYSKLVYDGNTPVIAFMYIEPSGGGMLASGVKLARGGASGFTIEEVTRNEATPCRDGLCTGGTLCVADSGVCASPGSGCDSCGDGEECVTTDAGPGCAAVLKTPKIEAYPQAAGLYISVAKLPTGGIGIAYYDRVAGTLNVAGKEADGWTSHVVDGGLLANGTTSDVGLGASLFIDDGGVWHLSYVDGYNEALKYARVVEGAVEFTEQIDQGYGVNDVPHPDGQHIVGDDSFIHVTPSGSIQISYQDASNGTLRVATGTPNATGGNDWSVKVVESETFSGYFSRQIEVGGALKLLHWGRQIITAEDGLKKTVGDVSIASP